MEGSILHTLRAPTHAQLSLLRALSSGCCMEQHWPLHPSVGHTLLSCLVLCLGFGEHLMAASKCAWHHVDQSGLPNTPLHPACLPLLPLALPTSDLLLEGRLLVLPFSVCHGTGLKSRDACSQTYLLHLVTHIHISSLLLP